MNWIKLEQGIHPPFGKLVLLYQYKDNNKGLADCGALKSIDKNGYNWDFGNIDASFLFGELVPLRGSVNFKPTHWCEIIPPDKQ